MIKFKSIVLLLAAWLFLASGRAEQTGELVVVFEGLENNQGTVIASLVDSERKFLAKDIEPLRRFSASPQEGGVSWVIPALALGSYAISAYHDANGNTELDTGLFGIPSEAYGFSNNVRGSFAPPDFAEAQFEFSGSGQQLTIRLR